ncbi:MAG: hypothetical protein WBG37_01245 [Desulfobacterales bacterium]
MAVPEFAELQAQFKSTGNKFEVKENFDEFRLTYTRGKGLSFNLPYFEVSLVSQEGIKDRNTAETGMQMMRDGAKQVIQGVVQALEGIFNEYELPDANKIENVEVVKNGSESRISFEQEGVKVTKICNDTHCETSVIQPPSQINSDEDYERVNGKLVIKFAISTIKQNQSMTIDAQTAIEYQNIGGVLFPAVIKTKSEVTLPSVKQEGRISIHLKNCKAN